MSIKKNKKGLKELVKRPADKMVDRLKNIVYNDRQRVKERRDE